MRRLVLLILGLRVLLIGNAIVARAWDATAWRAHAHQIGLPSLSAELLLERQHFLRVGQCHALDLRLQLLHVLVALGQARLGLLLKRARRVQVDGGFLSRVDIVLPQVLLVFQVSLLRAQQGRLSLLMLGRQRVELLRELRAGGLLLVDQLLHRGDPVARGVLCVERPLELDLEPVRLRRQGLHLLLLDAQRKLRVLQLVRRAEQAGLRLGREPPLRLRQPADLVHVRRGRGLLGGLAVALEQDLERLRERPRLPRHELLQLAHRAGVQLHRALAAQAAARRVGPLCGALAHPLHELEELGVERRVAAALRRLAAPRLGRGAELARAAARRLVPQRGRDVVERAGHAQRRERARGGGAQVRHAAPERGQHVVSTQRL